MGTPHTETRVRIHCLTGPYVPFAMEIDEASNPWPWSEAEFRSTIKRHGCAGLIADIGSLTVGYAVFERRGETLNILNMAVHPEDRRQCIGTRLVLEMVGRLEGRYTRIAAEIHERSVPAQLFLRNLGFKCVRQRRGHCQDGADAYVFEYRVQEV